MNRYTYDFSLPLNGSGDILSATVEYEIQDMNVAQFKNMQKLHDIVHTNIIRPRFRIFLLNADETICRQLPQDDIVSGGSYSENYQNGQRKSLSFSLINRDGKYTPSINGIWTGTKFLFEIGIEYPQQKCVVWFKKGVFVVNKTSVKHESNSQQVSIECVDKFGFLEGKACTIAYTTTVETTTEIEQIINDILMLPIGNGNVIDSKKIVYHEAFKGRKMPVEITEQAGSTYGSLILQIADVLSAEVYYNNEGNLVFVPTSDVVQDIDKATIDHLVDYNGDFGSNSYDIDFSSIVNTIVVIGANVNGHICMSVKKNENPNSPYCVQRIGERVAPIINDSNINTDYLADERAEYELRKALINKTSYNVSAFFNPLLNVNNVISITDEYFKINHVRFLINNISYNIGYDGLMTLQVCGMDNVNFK